MELFTPLKVGDLTLPNRIVMAPLTRTRASDEGVPGDLIVEHYRQRATMGLIITEGTYPTHESKSYPGQPGIVTDEQQAGWTRVVDAIHSEGGRVFMQVMHGGRVSHTEITGTERIVAPSAIAVQGEARTATAKLTYPVPHALTTDEVGEVVQAFVAAARRAIDAGFDGVELHGANGYLLHEFLSPASNQRDDIYGGSPENRIRAVVEVANAVVAEVGANRVALRISPAHNIQDVLETDASDVEQTYGLLVDALRPLGLAYLSILHAEPEGDLVQSLRKGFEGPVLLNTGFASDTTRDGANALVADGAAEAVVVGRKAIANPDLVARWRNDLGENEPNPATFYGREAEGYNDYPSLPVTV